jgi:hypothetical protein
MSEKKELIFAKDAQKSDELCEYQEIDRRAFLQLPVEQRHTLLREQVATVAEYFLPGAEGMEWTDEYIDDDWDNE